MHKFFVYSFIRLPFPSQYQEAEPPIAANRVNRTMSSTIPWSRIQAYWDTAKVSVAGDF